MAPKKRGLAAMQETASKKTTTKTSAAPAEEQEKTTTKARADPAEEDVVAKSIPAEEDVAVKKRPATAMSATVALQQLQQEERERSPSPTTKDAWSDDQSIRNAWNAIPAERRQHLDY